MKFQVFGHGFFSLLLVLFTNVAVAATPGQENLGAVQAVRRTFTLDLDKLLKQCHEGTSSFTDVVFECQVKEYSLNGTENLLQGTAGKQAILFFYDDAVSTVLEVTPEGYRTKTYLPATGGDGRRALQTAFSTHGLEGKKISVLVHMVP
jgi:hypothetical protein